MYEQEFLIITNKISALNDDEIHQAKDSLIERLKIVEKSAIEASLHEEIDSLSDRNTK